MTGLMLRAALIAAVVLSVARVGMSGGVMAGDGPIMGGRGRQWTQHGARGEMERREEGLACEQREQRGLAPAHPPRHPMTADLPHDASSGGHYSRRARQVTCDSEKQAEVLLGLGVSAIGTLPQGYAQNDKDAVGYAKALAAGRLPVTRPQGRWALQQGGLGEARSRRRRSTRFDIKAGCPPSIGALRVC